jgi:hypothetical protein
VESSRQPCSTDATSEVIEREAPKFPADVSPEGVVRAKQTNVRRVSRSAEEKKPAGLKTAWSKNRGSREQRDLHAGGDLPMGVKDLPVMSCS